MKCPNPETCKFGPHLAKPTALVMKHSFYNTMFDEHGPPNLTASHHDAVTAKLAALAESQG